MGQFVPPHDRLLVEELGQDRFRLLAPLWFQSDVLVGRIVKAPTDFVFDRESVPRWLPLAHALFSGTASRAGCIHDWLTQAQQVDTFKVTRQQADAVYYEANVAEGNAWWRRSLKWFFVRLAGWSSWRTGPGRLRMFNERRRRPRGTPAMGRDLE